VRPDEELVAFYDRIFGHLILSPSSHLMYRSSAIGDRLTGDTSELLSALGVAGPEEPAISSTSSVTTTPRFVISLFRVTRLCGKSPREV
jgi:hypothetical protein